MPLSQNLKDPVASIKRTFRSEESWRGAAGISPFVVGSLAVALFGSAAEHSNNRGDVIRVLEAGVDCVPLAGPLAVEQIVTMPGSPPGSHFVTFRAGEADPMAGDGVRQQRFQARVINFDPVDPQAPIMAYSDTPDLVDVLDLESSAEHERGFHKVGIVPEAGAPGTYTVEISSAGSVDDVPGSGTTTLMGRMVCGSVGFTVGEDHGISDPHFIENEDTGNFTVTATS